MFGLSPIHLIFLAVIVLILFGRGKISEFMGDFGKGIKSFKQGMAEDEQKPAPPPAQITSAAPVAPPPPAESEKAPDASNASNP
jgi:sec-independent protein translocase protein TatA